MTDTVELDHLIIRARALGATVAVEYDANILAKEGRQVHRVIQVSGLPGVGPCSMSPISAAETLRRANHHALHGLCRHGRRICGKCEQVTNSKLEG